MAKYNLGDLVKRGQEHEDDGSFERWDPPAGENLKCTVAQVKTDEDDDGTPRWGIRFTVVKGEHEGKSFWHNIRFSLEWDFINKQAVDAFEALGLAADFLSTSSPDAIGAAVEGKNAVVTPAYRNGKGKNKDKKYGNHIISSAKSAAAPPPPPPEDDGDDEDDWDED